MLLNEFVLLNTKEKIASWFHKMLIFSYITILLMMMVSDTGMLIIFIASTLAYIVAYKFKSRLILVLDLLYWAYMIYLPLTSEYDIVLKTTSVIFLLLHVIGIIFTLYLAVLYHQQVQNNSIRN